MKEVETHYAYKCDVCGKPIPQEDLVEVVIENTFNLGEDGNVCGTTEWHFHYKKCQKQFINHVNSKFKGSDYY